MRAGTVLLLFRRFRKCCVEGPHEHSTSRFLLGRFMPATGKSCQKGQTVSSRKRFPRHIPSRPSANCSKMDAGPHLISAVISAVGPVIGDRAGIWEGSPKWRPGRPNQGLTRLIGGGASTYTVKLQVSWGPAGSTDVQPHTSRAWTLLVALHARRAAGRACRRSDLEPQSPPAEAQVREESHYMLASITASQPFGCLPGRRMCRLPYNARTAHTGARCRT